MNHKIESWMRRVRRDGSSPRARLLSDERGLSTVEYVIILVLIAAACIALWVNLGGSLREKIERATDEIDNEVVMPDDR